MQPHTHLKPRSASLGANCINRCSSSQASKRKNLTDGEIISQESDVVGIALITKERFFKL